MSITGDSKDWTAKKKYGVTLHNSPQALAADAKDKGSVLNDKKQSGKRTGAQVLLLDDFDKPTKISIYVALGSDPTDNWVLLKQILGADDKDITPVQLASAQQLNKLLNHYKYK